MRELFKLIGMLFGSKPSDIDELVLLPMKHFPFKGSNVMMWCGRLIYRKKREAAMSRYIGTSAGLRLKTHETIHLKQAQVAGSWVKYYWRYFVEWLKGNPFCKPRESAYYTISFEMSAYANENNPDYAKNYDGSKLKLYKLDGNRKRLYKSAGGTPRAWKEYIRLLK